MNFNDYNIIIPTAVKISGNEVENIFKKELRRLCCFDKFEIKDGEIYEINYSPHNGDPWIGDKLGTIHSKKFLLMMAARNLFEQMKEK